MPIFLALLVAILVFALLWWLIGILPPPVTPGLQNAFRIILIVFAIVALVAEFWPGFSRPIMR